ncbi:hypothetical protein TWF696_009114 [Orbilia brochopaga]|uniref:Uncharacterized protein n=1 Tax=Orbilia brochopaga TaxID=3140254 RepID=A0AAV9UEW1_9PEZI
MKNFRGLRHKASSSNLRTDVAAELEAGASTDVQRVAVRALPSGGRTRGPRRFVSVDALAAATGGGTSPPKHGTLARVQSMNSSGGATSSSNTGSGSSSSGNTLDIPSSTANYTPAREIVRVPRKYHSASSAVQTRQIIRQGRTYSPVNRVVTGITDQAATENPEQGLVLARRAGISPPHGRHFESPFQGPYPTSLAILTTSFPDQEQAIVPLPFRLESAPTHEEQQIERFKPVSGRQSGAGFNRRQLTESSHHENNLDAGNHIRPVSPSRRLEAPPTDQEQRMIRRPTAFPPTLRRTSRFPHTVSAPSSSTLRNQRLLMPSKPDDESLWVDESSSDDSGSEGSDFGCIGLTKGQYEEMLAMGKGYPCRQILVEGVDQWPEAVKVDGYRRVWQWRPDEEY